MDENGSIVLKLHTYTAYFLLKYIFHEKLQVVVAWVSFLSFFCLV